jgi:hypothetical protein
VPVRIPVEEFAAIDNPTAPLSEPEAPDVIEIQLALLAAVQAQEFESEMETVAAPPLTPKFMFELEIANPQAEVLPP